MKKLKLSKILLERDWEKDSEIEYTVSDTDSETNSITWKVNYSPMKNISNNFQEAYNNFVDAIEQHPEDKALISLFEDFMTLKRQFTTHRNRTYGKKKG